MRLLLLLSVVLALAVVPLQGEAKLVTVALIFGLGAVLHRARPVGI